eukprot:7759722-Alexandrium_andersonii.AAC.1
MRPAPGQLEDTSGTSRPPVQDEQATDMHSTPPVKRGKQACNMHSTSPVKRERHEHAPTSPVKKRDGDPNMHSLGASYTRQLMQTTMQRGRAKP